MKRALISVSDKSGLVDLAKNLIASEFKIVSTGGTAKKLQEAGIEVQEVADLTQFPEMLGGRVKTLHPKVMAGVLARRDLAEHQEDLAKHDLNTFDLVIVNLYPFSSTVKNPDCSYQEAIEKIDIGGPTMIRAAAKNHEFLTVVTDPKQYPELLESLKQNSGGTSLELRKKFAREAFAHTASYDAIITAYFDKELESTESLPQDIPTPMEFKSSLRYGENPQQKAVLYSNPLSGVTGVANAKQLHGKELSFNNLLDLDAAWRICNEYGADIPCVAIIKHNNPCGVAIAQSPALAYLEALSCDSISAFGGIVGSNNIIDAAAAHEMKDIFLEAIIAPGFSPEALEILQSKKNLRLLEAAAVDSEIIIKADYDIKKISGGYLVQESDQLLLNKDDLEIVTEKQIEEQQWIDLLFAWKVVKHCKSNAIVTALAGKTLGIGVGQTSRIKAVEDALRNFNLDTRGAVLASDAFFPFADNIQLAAQNHIAAIIQPGGSIRDEEVIQACNEAGIAMAFTKCRHFRH